MNKKLLAIILTGISSVALAVGISACGGNTDGEQGPHTHSYDKQVTEEAFLQSAATCKAKAKYYFSCSCGKKGTETFEYGELGEHDYVKNICSLCEDDRTTQGLEYILNYNNTAYSLSGIGTAADKEVYVAYKYEGLPVTGIADYAFQDCDESLRYIAIPDSVASIGDNAFFNCTGLEAISVDDNNEKFSSVDGILYDKRKTWVIFVPKAIKGDVEIPSGVEIIRQSKFQNRSGLTGFIIPDSVKEIEKDAFLGCDGIIQSDNGVRYVDKWVIGYDDSISSIALRNNTRGIANNAFEDCGASTDVTLPDGAAYVGINAFKNCSDLADVIIPDSVKDIGANAFENSGLKTVMIGGGITLLRDNTFRGCSRLTSATLPNGLMNIGYYVFENCSNLESITIPDSVTNIWNAGFHNCGALTSVTLGNGLKIINDGLFENCVSLSSINIPDSVKTIGSRAFKNCSRLKSLKIPESVTSVDGSAFYGCDGIVKSSGGIQYVDNWAIDCDNYLENAYIRSGTTGIAFDTFRGGSLKKITIPYTVKYFNCRSSFSEYDSYVEVENGVQYIDKWVVGCEKSLTTASLRSDTKGISDFVFEQCQNLKSITLPDGLTSIGRYAFCYCEGLAINLVIPDSVTYLGDYAFQNCSALTGVTIGKGVTRIGDYAFQYCSALTSVSIDNSVKSIGNYAFDSCYQVTRLTIPDSVEIIGDYAFAEWVGITGELTIPNAVKKIGEHAFFSCSGLTSIKIGNGVNRIGKGVFGDCIKATSITIPESVKSIDGFAFNCCSALTDIIFEGTKAQWKAIEKAKDWCNSTSRFTVHCTDGDLSKEESLINEK